MDDLHESQRTTGQHFHHMNNVNTNDDVSKTADALINLATATQSDRQMLANLTDMNKKLLATIEEKDKEIQRLKEELTKARKGPPKRRPTMRYYCYTHGFNNTHESPDCKFPCEGHKNEATKTNTMGGNLRNA